MPAADPEADPVAAAPAVRSTSPTDLPNCPFCRYSRTGLDTRTCPECGYVTTDFDIAQHTRREIFMGLSRWPAYGWLVFHAVLAVVLGIWPLIPLAGVLGMGWWMFRRHGYERRRLSRRVWLMISPWVQVCWVLPQGVGWVIDVIYWNTTWLDGVYGVVYTILDPNLPLFYIGGGITTAGVGITIAMWRWRRLTRLAGLADGEAILSPAQRRTIRIMLLIPAMLIAAIVLTILLGVALDRIRPGWDVW